LVALIWIFIPQIKILYLILIFAAAFLIDFDHYAIAIFRTKKFSLKNAFDYYEKERLKEIKEIKRGIKRKGDFHFFHTIEFQALLGVLGFFWIGFFYLFVGMVFHSLLDLIDMLYKGRIHRREFFFFNWARKRKTKQN